MKNHDHQSEAVDAKIAELQEEIGRLRAKLANAKDRHLRDANTIASLRPLREMGVAIESWITSRHWTDEQSQSLLTIVRRALKRSQKQGRV